jgi:hypothetical protein
MGLGTGSEIKQGPNTAFNYIKANGNAISGQISTTTRDYIVNFQDMQGIGMTSSLGLPTLIALCSSALDRTPINSLAILGDITIGGLDYAKDFNKIDAFCDNLAKINPYETNLKFLQMCTPQSITDADNFSAEKDIWFISDKLIQAKPSYKNETGTGISWEDLEKFTQDLNKENDEFKKDFVDK